jgi:hypothetical protein
MNAAPAFLVFSLLFMPFLANAGTVTIGSDGPAGVKMLTAIKPDLEKLSGLQLQVSSAKMGANLNALKVVAIDIVLVTPSPEVVRCRQKAWY